MSWIFGKTYRHKCPDGSNRIIYRNIDDAFPLYIKTAKTSVNLDGGVSAESLGVGGAKGHIGTNFENQIEGLLYSINELNNSCMIHFRTIYATYATSPCKNDDFLQRNVTKVIDDQHRVSRLQIQARLLIELVRSHPENTVEILTAIKELAGEVGGKQSTVAANIEIREVRQLADEWTKRNGE